MDFKQVARILRSKWRFVFIATLLLTSLAGAYSYLYAQPIYEASAKLILTNGQADETGLSYNQLMANGMLIQTYGEIVRTPRLMEKVVENHPELHATADELAALVTTKTTNNQIMSIVVQDGSYDWAAAVANAVAGVVLTEIPEIIKVNHLFLLDQAAAAPHPEPINTKPEIKTAIAFVLSVVFSAGIVLLRHYLDDRVRSAQELETRLGLRALAALPRVKRSEAYPLIRNVPEEKTGEKAFVTVST
ncbi:YveK family protein [Cohnella caldifontis]|uniref:YveK family protein n=1 Tax=Cohnella caldifontis TaxID=3027471 RepID=UPI0023ECB9A7|nr:Wzz/FepE/Etk N-terminal domain-containing protein [Cohnella sp. YIM B05605]